MRVVREVARDALSERAKPLVGGPSPPSGSASLNGPARASAVVPAVASPAAFEHAAARFAAKPVPRLPGHASALYAPVTRGPPLPATRLTRADESLRQDGMGKGARLPEPLRAPYEPELGVDLSAVRVHTGSAAARAAAPGEQTAELPGQLLPIFDRIARKKVLVDAATYEQERVKLARALRFLAKAIPEDATAVLEEYPFGQVKEMFDDVFDSLKLSCEHYSKGHLLEAGMWAREAAQYSNIEMKAHKIFEQESALSYVGKRVGLAAIGFFEGAADSLLGLVDQGAGLFGIDTGLVEWNTGQYAQIKDAYGGATDIDHTLVHDDEIGRFGGRVAGSLALGKAMGGAGVPGQAAMVVLGAAGVKSAVTTVARLRSEGKSWGEILTDPVVIAQVAGAVAGIAGMGGSAAPQLREFFTQVGLGATAAQMAAMTAKIVSVYGDKTLGSEDKFNQLLDLFGEVIVTGGLTADGLPTKGASSKQTPRAEPESALALVPANPKKSSADNLLGEARPTLTDTASPTLADTTSPTLADAASARTADAANAMPADAANVRRNRAIARAKRLRDHPDTPAAERLAAVEAIKRLREGLQTISGDQKGAPREAEAVVTYTSPEANAAPAPAAPNAKPPLLLGPAYKYKSFREIPMSEIPATDQARLRSDFSTYDGTLGTFENYARYRYGLENKLFPPNAERGLDYDWLSPATGRVAEEFWSHFSGDAHNKQKFSTEYGNVEPDFIPPVAEQRRVVDGSVQPATRPEDALLIADSKVLTQPIKEKGQPVLDEHGYPSREVKPIGITDQIRGLIELAARTQSKTLVLIGQEGVSLTAPLIAYAKQQGVTVQIKVLVTPSGHVMRN